MMLPISDAALIPPRAGNPRSGGVFAADGSFVPACNILRDDAPELDGIGFVAPPAHRLPGRHLYAGQLSHHFGHFLCESLSRLWPLHAPEHGIASVLFILRRDGAAPDLQPFQAEMFALLGIDIPITVITRDTTVETLIVPHQGFGTGSLAAATAEFRAFIRARLAPDIVADGPADLYISRQGLSLRRGAMLGEANLERCLADNGYTPFSPEGVPLATQIARYRAARRVIGIEGSALHLFGLVGRAHQQVAVIARRTDTRALDVIAAQIDAFCATAPLRIVEILREWDVQDGEARTSKSISQMKLRRVRGRLVRAGFVPDTEWQIDKTHGDRRIARIAAKTGRAYRAIPSAPDLD